jgi:hypothetical protein
MGGLFLTDAAQKLRGAARRRERCGAVSDETVGERKVGHWGEVL